MDTAYFPAHQVLVRGPFRKYNPRLDCQSRSTNHLHRGPDINPFPIVAAAWVFSCPYCHSYHTLAAGPLPNDLPCGGELITFGKINSSVLTIERPNGAVETYGDNKTDEPLPEKAVAYFLEWQRILAKQGKMGNVLIVTDGPVRFFHKEIVTVPKAVKGFAGTPTYVGNDYCLVVELGTKKVFDTSGIKVNGPHVRFTPEMWREALTGENGAWWDWDGKIFRAHYATACALNYRGSNSPKKDRLNAVIFDPDADLATWHPYVDVVRERPSEENLVKGKWCGAIYITNGEDMHSKYMRSVFPNSSFSACKRSILGGSSFASAVKELAKRLSLPYNQIVGVWSQPQATNAPVFDSRLIFTNHSVASSLVARGKIKGFVFAMGPNENLPKRLPAPLDLLPDECKAAVRSWGADPLLMYGVGGVVIGHEVKLAGRTRLTYGVEDVRGTGVHAFATRGVGSADNPNPDP